MARSPLDSASLPCGIGIGLRIEFASELFADTTTAIDFVEIHPENYVDRGGAHISMLERALDRYPVLTHGLTMGFGGVESPSASRLRALRGLLDRVGSPLHSDHFCFASARGRFAHELLPLPFDAATRDVAVDRIARMQDATGRPVAVENVSYYVKRALDPLDEIDALVEIVERANAKLLLDVNNVVVNAHNHGFDARAWLERVPYDRVAQIHVAGHLIRPDGLRIDTHGASVDAEVSELLGEVLLRTGPVPVLLERDSEMPSFEALARELATLRGIYDGAMNGAADTSKASLPPAFELRQPTVDIREPDEAHATHVAPDGVPARRTPSTQDEAGENGTQSRQAALNAEDPRAAEPTDLECLEHEVISHLFAPSPGTLGDGQVRERWDLYRRMARGRLEDLFGTAFQRTRDTVGSDSFKSFITSFFASSSVGTPIFWRVADELASYMLERFTHGSVAMDVLQLEQSVWRVRHAPYATATTTLLFDFTRPALLNPARESFETHHAVYEVSVEGAEARVEQSTLVVFRREDDSASTLSLNPLAASIYRELAKSDACVRDVVIAVATERDVRVDGAFLEALAATFAQWIELGLVLGAAEDG